MGKHSIPGPNDDDTPREPFRATPQKEPFPPESAGEPHEPLESPPDYEPEHAAPPPAGAGPGGEVGRGYFADGNWQGGHRTTDGKRRGISIGVIVALVVVVVVVGAVILWRFFGDALSDRSDVAAAACSGSEVPVAVVTDPAIAVKIAEFADNYNRTAGPIGDRCVKLTVKAADSDEVIDGLTGDWPTELGLKPAMWIPGSSVSTARLQATAGPNIISDSRSLVSSPVVLAIKPQLAPALADKGWADLPRLQTSPVSLERMNMPGWGSLRLALPTGNNEDATYLAAEAVAAASAPPDAPASAGVAAVNALIGAQPQLNDAELSTAMDALLADGDPAAGQVHAVVITEQQLYQRAAEVPDAKNVVGSWRPSGPTALADYPMASLSGDWLSEEQLTAASEFKKFLQKPEQLAELAKEGFRAGDQPLPTSEVTGFTALSDTLSVGDASARATIAGAVGTPAAGSAVTIVLDQSMPEEDGDASRLANVTAALKSKLAALPPSAVVGLWTFDGVEGRSEVSTGLLSDEVGGEPRSAALTAALDDQFSSGGGAVSFTTLRLVYEAALENFRPGMNNSVLVITTGPHTDQTLGGTGLQDYVRESFDPQRPVAINVIDFEADSDSATWEAVAQTTGGSYQNLATSDSPELATAVATFIG